jgi:septum formation protein
MTSARLLLASTSATRRQILEHAGLPVETTPPRVDEAALRLGLEAEAAGPTDVAAALAQAKALRVSARSPGRLVLGCDQVLDLDGRVLAKPETHTEAALRLRALSGREHRLVSAAVVALDGAEIWRVVDEARLTLHSLTEAEIAAYLERNWPAVASSPGAYLIESEGVRLMSRISGDHFTILGLPLIPLLTWLRLRGDIGP